MKIIKILGGLGNQMFQYALYLAIKDSYQNEKVKIDTSCFRGYPLHNGYELDKLFCIDADEATFMDKLKIAYPYTHYHIWQVLHKLGIKRATMLVENANEGYEENVFHTEHDCYYDGYWQNERYFKFIRPKVLQAFSPKVISEQNLKFCDKIRQHKCVSIHIRRGDYVNHPLYGNICDKAYYQRAITYIKEKTDCDYYIIFSNDIKWCEENLSDLLMGKNVVFVNWNKGKDSYQDMYLMSRCNYNIIANSSFSWWGAWLNFHEDKIVICPTKWNNIKSSKFDLPQSWIKI